MFWVLSHNLGWWKLQSKPTDCLGWDFPGGPVVKNLCFHCRRHGELRSCMLHNTAKNNQRKKKKPKTNKPIKKKKTVQETRHREASDPGIHPGAVIVSMDKVGTSCFVKKPFRYLQRTALRFWSYTATDKPSARFWAGFGRPSPSQSWARSPGCLEQ